MTETLLVPEPAAPRPLKAPKIAEARLSNGLRVMVVRKPTVPRAEIRLIIPVSGKPARAANRVLVKTLTSGTTSASAAEIAQRLQGFGASFGAAITSDHMQVSGSTLSSNLKPYLKLVGELLTAATFPADEIAVERERIVQEVAISRGQPQTVVTEALFRRLFGKHPYGDGLPDPEAVSKVGRTKVANVYTAAVKPKDAVLVIVGDVAPAKTIEIVSETLGGWRGRQAEGASQPPPPIKTGPLVLVDRPGSVQTNIRLAGPVPGPDADDAVALDVANTIFGGYFVSRFVDNLRERNGYTYSPFSSIAHRKQASFLYVAADVGIEVTLPSLVETHYELARMASTNVTAEELVSAQRYLVGISAIRIQTQAGLASTLTGLVVHGLGVDYLRRFPKQVYATTVDEVREASMRYLAPSRLVTVALGDASKISGDLEALGEVQLMEAPA